MNQFRRAVGVLLIGLLSQCFTARAASSDPFGPGTTIADPVELAQTLARIRALRLEVAGLKLQHALSPTGEMLVGMDEASLRMPPFDPFDPLDRGGRISARIRGLAELCRKYGGLTANQLLAVPPPVGGEPVTPRGMGSGGEKAGTAGATKPLSLAGLPSEAALILGLADFLAERAKAELVQTILVDLRKRLAGDRGSISGLMPASMAVLEQVEVTGYRALTPALASAFHRDLENLPERLVASDSSSLAYRARFPASRIAALRVGLRLYRDVRTGISPTVALQGLLGPATDSIADPGLKVTLLLAGSLGRDFSRHPTREGGWFEHADQLADYASALLLSLGRQVPDSAAARVLASAWGHPEVIQAFLQNLQSLQRGLDPEPGGKPADASGKLESVLTAVDGLVSLATRLCEDSAPSAKALLELKQQFQFARALQGAIAGREWGKVAADLLQQLPKRTEGGQSADARFLMFACNLASARDADGVREALNAMAEPVGSFRAKRTAPDRVGANWQLTVNAYVGPAAGMESRRERGALKDPATSLSLAGLLGVEFSHSLQCGVLRSGSLLISAIDLGNVISYRAGHKDGLTQAPELGFRQVLSPGVFMVFGLTSDRPVSAGFGYQIAPRLRQDLTLRTEKDVQRLSVFVAFDLPVIRL